MYGYDGYPDPTAIFARMAGPILFIGLIATIVALMAWWQIVKKAGYNPAWSLFMFVPGANVIMFLIFAFSDWPVNAKVAGLVARIRRGGPIDIDDEDIPAAEDGISIPPEMLMHDPAEVERLLGIEGAATSEEGDEEDLGQEEKS